MPTDRETGALSNRSPVVVDRSKRVRGRLGRNLAPILLAAIVLCSIVVWNRDATQMDAARKRLDPWLEPIRRHLADQGTLPLQYPADADVGGMATSDGFDYAEPSVVTWAQRVKRSAVIGFSKRSTGLIFHPNGRAVAVFEKGQVRSEWMSGADLNALLEEQQRLAALAPSP